MTHSEAVRRLRDAVVEVLRAEHPAPTLELRDALIAFDALPPEPVCEHDRYWKLGDARWCHECGALKVEGTWTPPKSRPTQEREPTGAISLRGFSATKDRLIAEVRDSERITARDLAVTVGPVPPPPAQTVDPVALAQGEEAHRTFPSSLQLRRLLPIRRSRRSRRRARSRAQGRRAWVV